MGRELASYDDISYTYDENGMRASKTVNGKTTKYYYDGNRLMHIGNGSKSVTLIYDRFDEAIGLYYTNQMFFYVKNLQGDITALISDEGFLMAKYAYDDWGNCTVITSSGTSLNYVANVNPLRYRGYVYDNDTGLYYLQSRYYDPEVGRFINCDDVNYIGVTESEVSYNPFAYCENDPVNDSDPNGTISLEKVKEFFANVFRDISEKIKERIKNLVYIKNGVISIASSVFEVTINELISILCSRAIVKLSSSVLKFVLNRYKEKAPQKVVDVMKYVINGLDNRGIIRFIARAVAKKLVVRKTIVKDSVVSAIAKNMLSSILLDNSKLLSKVGIICSALSSIGGFLAFFLSGLDGSWLDGYLRIDIKKYRRRYL